MPEEPSEEYGARAEFNAMAERLRETIARRKAARLRVAERIRRFRETSGKRRGGSGRFDDCGPGLEPAPVRPNRPNNLSGGAEAPLDP